VSSVQKYSIIILKAIIVLIILFMLIISVVGIISLTKDPINPIYGHILYPIVVGTYVSTFIIYLAFYHTFMFLNLVKEKLSFSINTKNRLNIIKTLGLIFAILYTLLLPFVYMLANLDDAPGVIFVGMIPLVGGFIVYLFADILIKLIDQGLSNN
jgi:hypothetical protein